jgi:hypothetical protein
LILQYNNLGTCKPFPSRRGFFIWLLSFGLPFYSDFQKYVPFGYEFYVIRRNNAIPFVFLYFGAAYPHPFISEQPQWTNSHEAVYSVRLYNFVIVCSGALLKPLDKSSANHIIFIPKQDSSYRNIIMRTAIFPTFCAITEYSKQKNLLYIAKQVWN